MSKIALSVENLTKNYKKKEKDNSNLVVVDDSDY